MDSIPDSENSDEKEGTKTWDSQLFKNPQTWDSQLFYEGSVGGVVGFHRSGLPGKMLILDPESMREGDLF